LKSVFIASDMHLGAPDEVQSLIREKKLIEWLDSIQQQAIQIILLGDIFDFWFEYNHVIPKYHFRLLAKLSEIQDKYQNIIIFVGNHDLWMRDFFPKYLNIPVLHQEKKYEWFGKSYFVAHGDGLGPGDHGFKFMKKCFKNPFLHACFKWIHPDVGIGLANYFSRKSRKTHAISDEDDHGEKEFLFQFVKKYSQENPAIQYYVFGHRHQVKHQKINEAEMFVLGDWITKFSYLKIDENGPQILYFTQQLNQNDDA